MTAIDSRSALLHYELLNAIAFARRMSGGDTDGFLHALHEQGFMIVPIPPEPEPADLGPIEPAAPIAEPAPDPEFRLTNETSSWEIWLKQVRHLEGNALPWLEDTLRHHFDCGKTPDEALEIPF